MLCCMHAVLHACCAACTGKAAPAEPCGGCTAPMHMEEEGLFVAGGAEAATLGSSVIPCYFWFARARLLLSRRLAESVHGSCRHRRSPASLISICGLLCNAAWCVGASAGQQQGWDVQATCPVGCLVMHHLLHCTAEMHIAFGAAVKCTVLGACDCAA